MTNEMLCASYIIYWFPYTLISPFLQSSNVHELNKLIITSFDDFLMANKWTSITHLLQADRHKYHHRVSCPVVSHPGHV